MAMAAKTTALQASRARRPPLHCHRGLCCFKSPSRKTGKGILPNLCNTQESRGGLTPRQPAIPRQGGYLRTEDAAGRQQKGFPMITRRNCLIGASAALIGVLFEPETSWRSAVCRFNAPTMAFAIGYESIAFITLEIAGWRPDPRSRRRTSTSHTAGEARL